MRLTFGQWEFHKVGEECLCPIVGRALGKFDQAEGKSNQREIGGHFAQCLIFFIGWRGEHIIIGFLGFLRCLRVPP